VSLTLLTVGFWIMAVGLVVLVVGVAIAGWRSR